MVAWVKACMHQILAMLTAPSCVFLAGAAVVRPRACVCT